MKEKENRRRQPSGDIKKQQLNDTNNLDNRETIGRSIIGGLHGKTEPQ